MYQNQVDPKQENHLGYLAVEAPDKQPYYSLANASISKKRPRGFGAVLVAVAVALVGVVYLVNSRAATPPAFSVVSSGPSTRLSINGAYSGSTAPVSVGKTVFGWPINPIMESPPWVIDHNGSNGWTSLLLSSADTVGCSAGQNLALNNPFDCTGASVRDSLQTQNDQEKYTADTISSTFYYKRNYFGAYAGQVIAANGNYYRFTVNHGENKNNITYSNGSISQPRTGNNYPATVKTLNPAWDPINHTGCSEYDPGGVTTCQNTTVPWYSNAAYSGFISSSVVQETAANGWGNNAVLADQGPIVWPELGYGVFTSANNYPNSPNSFQYMGVRHPYSIVIGGYIYVYYLDTSGSNTTTGDGSGADTGIKVARSPVSSLGGMGTWNNYNPGDGQWDLPSIPTGMNVGNMGSYLNSVGPQESPLWSSSPEAGGYVPVSFQVASVAGQASKYIGVESEYSNTTGAWRAELRTSSDLVNWSDPLQVPATAGAGNVNGESGGELFSILLSADGSSNTSLSGFDSSTDQLPLYVESSISSIPYLQKLTVRFPPAATVATYNYSSITSRNSGKCLDVKANSTADGATVDQWSCNGGGNQQWKLNPSAVSGYYWLVNRNSGKCLDVKANSTADGATVDQWSCNGGGNQQWKLNIGSASAYSLVNRNSGKCLDVKANSTADGATVDQWSCNGGGNQQWKGSALNH